MSGHGGSWIPAPLHPQARALVTAAAAQTAPATLAERRADYAETARRLGGDAEAVADVADLEVPGPDGPIPARAWRPAAALDADDGPAVLWLHGGGWVMGDLDGIDRVCRALANAAGAVVVAADYRLAPEHPFPAAVRDADAAVAWLRGSGAQALGADPRRLVVGGDSAGANLATVAALHAPGAAAAQLLVYPAVDAAGDTPSWRAAVDNPVLSADAMREMWRLYLGGGDPLAPDASPLRAELAGAPPALVAVAGHDPLHDEGVAYARALRRAGVEAELLEYDDMPHGFLRWAGRVDRARELVAQLGGFVRRHAGDATG